MFGDEGIIVGELVTGVGSQFVVVVGDFWERFHERESTKINRDNFYLRKKVFLIKCVIISVCT